MVAYRTLCCALALAPRQPRTEALGPNIQWPSPSGIPAVNSSVLVYTDFKHSHQTNSGYPLRILLGRIPVYRFGLPRSIFMYTWYPIKLISGIPLNKHLFCINTQSDSGLRPYLVSRPSHIANNNKITFILSIISSKLQLAHAPPFSIAHQVPGVRILLI